MGDSFAASFQYLARTDNEAAVDVLVEALDSDYEPARHGALRALLERRSPAGHQEVFRRLPRLDEASLAVVRQRGERLLPIITASLAAHHDQAAAAGCSAAVALRLYDALGPLVAAVVDSDCPHAELLAETILKLTEQFYAELSAAADQPRQKDIDVVRQRVTAALEDGVRKYHRHRQAHVLEALLLVARQNNATLRQLLSRPDEKSHQPIVALLASSDQGGVMRLLLGLIEDPQAPRAAVKVLAERCDAKFVDHLLRTVGPRPGRAVSETLSRIDSIAWARPGHEVFAELSEEAQEGAVSMLLASGVDRGAVRATLGHLLLCGKPLGRRAGARALKDFPEPEAGALVVKGLADKDAEVRAALIVQLRPRRIPNALSLLIRMVDSPEQPVRDALHEALPEFTFRQFLARFDAMDEQLRLVAGHLVRRLDPEVSQKLLGEIACPSPVRRRRAVLAASAMGMVDALEQHIAGLLGDDDHMVRVAAAKALAEGTSMPTWEALRDALLDRSYIVKEAAEQSLERLSRSLASADEAAADQTAGEAIR